MAEARAVDPRAVDALLAGLARALLARWAKWPRPLAGARVIFVVTDARPALVRTLHLEAARPRLVTGLVPPGPRDRFAVLRLTAERLSELIQGPSRAPGSPAPALVAEGNTPELLPAIGRLLSSTPPTSG
jgi:hypothetical protein